MACPSTLAAARPTLRENGGGMDFSERLGRPLSPSPDHTERSRPKDGEVEVRRGEFWMACPSTLTAARPTLRENGGGWIFRSDWGGLSPPHSITVSVAVHRTAKSKCCGESSGWRALRRWPLRGRRSGRTVEGWIFRSDWGGLSPPHPITLSVAVHRTAKSKCCGKVQAGVVAHVETVRSGSSRIFVRFLRTRRDVQGCGDAALKPHPLAPAHG